MSQVVAFCCGKEIPLMPIWRPVKLYYMYRMLGTETTDLIQEMHNR